MSDPSRVLLRRASLEAPHRSRQTSLGSARGRTKRKLPGATSCRSAAVSLAFSAMTTLDLAA